MPEEGVAGPTLPAASDAKTTPPARGTRSSEGRARQHSVDLALRKKRAKLQATWLYKETVAATWKTQGPTEERLQSNSTFCRKFRYSKQQRILLGRRRSLQPVHLPGHGRPVWPDQAARQLRMRL